MAEYIEREVAIKAIYDSDPNGIRRTLGFNVGQIEEALRAVPAVSVPQWISVKDRLPRDGEIVLCYTRWGFACLQFDAEYHFWIDSNDCHSDSHILYWMLLPKAPKGDADNG